MKQLSKEAILIGVEEWKDEYFTPELKVVGCPMTGTDHLPVKEFEKRGIKLISLKGHDVFLKTIFSTAEHTIGLIIALMRNYKTALNTPYKDRDAYIGHTLSDKVLGVIGFGRCGKQVKKIAVGLSMTVITHDKGEPYLDNLLEESDVVTLHIPLDGNEGYFTKEMFSKMKPNAILINTSRDKVIEKGALLNALSSGIIAGAAVDFLDDENLVEYAKTHNNLILTNHLGGCTEEDMEATENWILLKIKNYLNAP